MLQTELTEQLIKQELEASTAQRIVTQGFIADDVDTGDKTNLGRGGSDFTAALIAAALNAECLEIWTDCGYETHPCVGQKHVQSHSARHCD